MSINSRQFQLNNITPLKNSYYPNYSNDFQNVSYYQPRPQSGHMRGASETFQHKTIRPQFRSLEDQVLSPEDDQPPQRLLSRNLTPTFRKTKPTTAFLPYETKNGKKTLILDLDETLVHSSFKPLYFKADITLNVNVDGINHPVHVLKRPYVDEFLRKMAEHYEIVVFTASISQYANPLLDRLDPMNLITHRLFREHCVCNRGLYIKDLRRLGRELKDMLIVDNNPISYTVNVENGIPIPTWHYDKTDTELLKLIPILEYLAYADDVRGYVKKIVSGNEIDFSIANRIIDKRETYNDNSNIRRNDYDQIINNTASLLRSNYDSALSNTNISRNNYDSVLNNSSLRNNYDDILNNSTITRTNYDPLSNETLGRTSYGAPTINSTIRNNYTPASVMSPIRNNFQPPIRASSPSIKNNYDQSNFNNTIHANRTNNMSMSYSDEEEEQEKLNMSTMDISNKTNNMLNANRSHSNFSISLLRNERKNDRDYLNMSSINSRYEEEPGNTKSEEDEFTRTGTRFNSVPKNDLSYTPKMNYRQNANVNTDIRRGVNEGFQNTIPKPEMSHTGTYLNRGRPNTAKYLYKDTPSNININIVNQNYSNLIVSQKDVPNAPRQEGAFDIPIPSTNINQEGSNDYSQKYPVYKEVYGRYRPKSSVGTRTISYVPKQNSYVDEYLKKYKPMNEYNTIQNNSSSINERRNVKPISYPLEEEYNNLSDGYNNISLYKSRILTPTRKTNGNETDFYNSRSVDRPRREFSPNRRRFYEQGGYLQERENGLSFSGRYINNFGNIDFKQSLQYRPFLFQDRSLGNNSFGYTSYSNYGASTAYPSYLSPSRTNIRNQYY